MKTARGMGGIYLRSSIWWVHYSAGGRQYLESSRSTVKKRAIELLRQRHAEIDRGEFVGPKARELRFEDLAQKLEADYVRNGRRSLKDAKHYIARLGRTFAGWKALAITTEAIEKYRDAELERGLAPATVNLDLSALKRMFNLAVRARLLAMRPYIPMLELHNARRGFFEHEAFERVLAALPEDLRPLVEAGYTTGWRRGELVGLTWSQVDLQAKVMRLEPGTTKNNEGRTFPWGNFPRLSRVLLDQAHRTRALELRKGRIVSHVFHRGGRPIQNFYKAWRDACAKAGCPGMLFHDLRRTAVRNLERAGVPRSVAMQLTGHKTESVYRRYAIVSEADLSVGVARLAELHAGLERRHAAVVETVVVRRERVSASR